MIPDDLRLEFLTKQHDRTRFDCGADDINAYLRTQARQDAEKDLARTFVLIHSEEPIRIRAYYTLAYATLSFEEVPEEKRLSRYPAPVALLAQLGVDQEFQKGGLGSLLMLDAMARVERLSRQMGLYALVLDAREESLFAYYERFGFRRATGSERPLRMYLKLSRIRALGLTPVPIEGE